MELAALAPDAAASCIQEEPVGPSKEAFKRSFLDNLFYIQGKFPALATKIDYYMALAYTVRDRMLQRWISTAAAYTKQGSRTVAYFSAEFLMGPHLGNNLINLGIYDEVRQAIRELGLNFDELLAQEDEPGLGNGGLGRLAACFIDSLATLEIPALGYGIRYEFGIFQQEIVDGWQVERTDKWLRFGNPWEIVAAGMGAAGEVRRPHRTLSDEHGRRAVRWVPARSSTAFPTTRRSSGTATTPRTRCGCGGPKRRSRSTSQSSIAATTTAPSSRRSRPRTSARCCIRTTSSSRARSCGWSSSTSSSPAHCRTCCASSGAEDSARAFSQKFAVQLNDTHPGDRGRRADALAGRRARPAVGKGVEHHQQDVRVYQSHAAARGARSWPLALFGSILPRHLEIIFEINARFLDEVRIGFFGDEERIARLSLINEHGERYVRMAHLACVGSHAINGVAELHSELLKQDVLRDFHALWPEKFRNKTNGVTPRRWMVLANPRLARADFGGSAMLDQESRELRRLQPLVDERDFRTSWRDVKHANKRGSPAM